MEPERKIEKLLRAYAKKRRVQAGDPPVLHPATRRLLQGEVARRALKPDDESSLSLWEFFHQHWAFLLSFTLVIFLGVAMFLPALSSAKKKALAVSALNNLKQIGLAAQIVAEGNNGQLPASLSMLTNQLGSAKILVDPQSQQPFVYFAGSKNLNGLPDNAVLAYSPANNKDRRAVLFADGSVTMVNAAQFSEMTKQQPAHAAGFMGSLADDLAVNKAIAPTFASEERLASTHNLGVFYSITNSILGSATTHAWGLNGVTLFKNIAAIATNAPVLLANFQVQQNGNAIRIVDADGSVYDGALQLARADLLTNAIVTGTPPASPLPTGPNYYFRVTGTNQTLHQNVVFSGNLLALADATTNAPSALNRRGGSGGGGGGQWRLTVTNQSPWVNSRITGTATMANTNRIEINAVSQ